VDTSQLSALPKHNLPLVTFNPSKVMKQPPLPSVAEVRENLDSSSKQLSEITLHNGGAATASAKVAKEVPFVPLQQQQQQQPGAFTMFCQLVLLLEL
jgi:hypothetical protein